MQPLNKFKSYLYTLNYYLSSDYDLFKIKIFGKFSTLENEDAGFSFSFFYNSKYSIYRIYKI